MQISRERIRLLLDQQDDGETLDTITGSTARAARGNDMQFEFAFGVTIQDVFTLLDVSNIQSVLFTVKDTANRGGTTLMQKSIGAGAINPLLTPDSWDDGSAQHCIIVFTDDETQLDLGTQNEKTFYWSVRITTNDGFTFTAGDGELKLYNDGVSAQTNVTPPIGSSLVPAGALYSGAGAYALNGLTPGLYYSWEKGANDTDLVNGTQTLTGTGWFLAQGSSVTLHGTASALITALVRWPRIPTYDDLLAANAGKLKVINDAGVLVGTLSPNGKVLRLEGVGDDENPISQIIRLAP